MNSAKELKQLFCDCKPLFIALGDEVRLSIIETLGSAAFGEHPAGLSVNEITRQTYLSRPAVSHHLKILKDAGLIDMHPFGTRNYYFLNLAKSTERLMELVLMLKECTD